MRPVAYGLMALGVVIGAAGLVVLSWHDNLHKPFSHNEGLSIALFVGGAAFTYLGMLVRRRHCVMKERDRAA